MERIDVPGHVLEVCRELGRTGYQAFIVGGAVRDALLGRPAVDWDVATDAPPAVVQRIFPDTIPTGARYGTVTVLVPVREQTGWVRRPVQVTMFRTEGEYRDGRRPEWVAPAHTIEEDLSRRDLTVNAIAYDPWEERLVDPFGGRADLATGIVRTVGDPARRFREDGLRLMRAVRLATELGFRMEAGTWRALQQEAPRLARVSRERVGEEWRRLLRAEAAGRGLVMIYESGLLLHVLPVPHPGRNAVERTKAALDRLPAGDGPERVAAVLVGLSRDDLDDCVLRALVYPRAHAKSAVHLARMLRVFSADAVGTEPALRRFLRGLGRSNAAAFARLWQAWQPVEPARLGDGLAGRIVRVAAPGQPIDLSDLAVGGRDVQAVLGIGPGPEVGEWLERLLQHVFEHPEDNRRDRLVHLLRTWKTGARQPSPPCAKHRS
ncbi:MAG: hypothetical protein H0Z37_02105 [Firmicutes bacterium]|nr:hypothetical protein [Bacillota bacterium]